ncbi:MAG: hypothetical protein J1F11_09605 [Oscillospiraceae bacterium]|nr:hypothetical protein [Oscillospiraceae bacterium]
MTGDLNKYLNENEKNSILKRDDILITAFFAFLSGGLLSVSFFADREVLELYRSIFFLGFPLRMNVHKIVQMFNILEDKKFAISKFVLATYKISLISLFLAVVCSLSFLIFKGIPFVDDHVHQNKYWGIGIFIYILFILSYAFTTILPFFRSIIFNKIDIPIEQRPTE